MPAQTGRAGGRDGHRKGDLLSEQGRRGGAARDIHQRAMPELDLLERGAVVPQRDLVLGGAVHELKHAAGQAALRGLPQVEHIVAVVESGHSLPP